MGRHRSIRVSKAQVRYLEELLQDDLAETELTPDEREQAESLLGRAQTLLDHWSIMEEEDE